ncbi:MAG: hypothetical protein ACOCQT_05080 [Desulfovermiculus sp.]
MQYVTDIFFIETLVNISLSNGKRITLTAGGMTMKMYLIGVCALMCILTLFAGAA